MSSFALKWIAVLTMLIDHIGVALLPSGTPLYLACRAIGRIAFPLFAFMLAEGFYYTKNVRSYLLRLLLFALLSEVPFDLMVFGTPFYWAQQNVYFTLFFGLLALYFFDEFARRDQRWSALLALLVAAGAATLLGTDYGAYGLLMMFIFYLFRDNRRRLVLCFCGVVVLYTAVNVVSAWPHFTTLMLNLLQPVALLPILLYSRERKKGYMSRGWQYAFYLFYPAHMLVLYLLSLGLGA